MNPSLLPGALLVWSAQAFLLAAAAALAALAIAHPKGRLALWQGLLLTILLLPAIEPWKTPTPQPAEPAPAASTAAFVVTRAAPSSALHWRPEYWLWLLACGAALRLIWVAAGFLRLQRYRREAHPLPEPPLRFASHAAAWYASDSIPGPVTYGWRHPVILLPSKTLDLPAHLREAIQCHELIHVRRNDWLWVLAETLVRSLLWFHPAVWFVAGRIQLAREQVVDREAVSLLQNREQYVDALVAVAGYQLQSPLAPAFLRKSHLLARVNAVVKEIPMSRSRIAASIAAACSLLPLAALAAMWLFPFMAPPVSIAQGNNAQVNNAQGNDTQTAPTPAPSNPLGTLRTIQFSGLAPDAEQQLRTRLKLRVGDPVTSQDISDMLAAVQSFDARLSFSFSVPQPGDVTLRIAVAPSATSQALPPGVYHPGGDVTNPIPISHPQPQLSEQARKAKWGGTVLLSVVIDETGVPQDIKVVKPLGMGLDEKAIEAVSQWRFRPGTKNGQPVKVAAQIEVAFHPE